ASADRSANELDEGGRVRNRLLVLLQDRPERLLAPSSLVGLAGVGEEDADQALGAVETSPEVVLLPALAAEEGAEVVALGTDQLLLLAGQRRHGDPVGVPRAHPDDLDGVVLAHV